MKHIHGFPSPITTDKTQGRKDIHESPSRMDTDGKGRLLYGNLTYEVIGALYEVYNTLGFGYQEKYYQRAIAQELTKRGLHFNQENFARIKYKNTSIGKYFYDFLIENKLVLELKVGNDLYQENLNQLLGYLKDSGRRLGILVVFTKEGVKYRRVIN